MEDKKRNLRPRRHFTSGEGRAEKVTFSSEDYSTSRTYSSHSEGRSFGGSRPGGERKPYGERKAYGEGKPYGERKSFGEHKPYGERSAYGEKRGFQGKPGFDKRGGKPYGKPAFKGGKPGFRKPFGPHFDESEGSGIDRMISRRPQVSDRQAPAGEAKGGFQEVVRLNKYIANSGVCSRREADTFIEAGCVTVNGEVVTELGTKVNVLTDDVRFNGERLHGEEKVYIVMNKPKGYVTTAADRHAEKTVMDLLKGCRERVFPVGRLDKNTTGVLMFTNDGEISERLTHPSYNKKKIYQVMLDHDLKEEDRERILEGIELGDGVTMADEVEYIDELDHRKVGVEIHSGKNRVVRRIFESLGYDVKALDRAYFAGLTKKGLKKGEWRYLSEGEVNILKMGAYV